MESPTIILAPDSFKGSMDASEVAQNLNDGIRSSILSDPNIEVFPLADGGPGTIDSIVEFLDAEKRKNNVKGPLGQEVEAEWAWIPDFDGGPAAIIEMAQASGIELLSDNELDPMKANTYGTGQLLLQAVESGAETVILGLGGSATVDGGIGALKALGFSIRDDSGNEIKPEPGLLDEVVSINGETVPDKIQNVTIEVACDVGNPLLGDQGAAAVYAPQKGATRSMTEKLREKIRDWATIVDKYDEKKFYDQPGTGAAGGIGFALGVLLGANLKSGADLLMQVTDLNSRLRDADVVITGEGKIDRQTTYGKAPFTLAKQSQAHNVPYVLGIAAIIEDDNDEIYDVFDVLFSITRGPISKKKCIDQVDELLQDTGSDIGRIIDIFE